MRYRKTWRLMVFGELAMEHRSGGNGGVARRNFTGFSMRNRWFFKHNAVEHVFRWRFELRHLASNSPVVVLLWIAFNYA